MNNFEQFLYMMQCYLSENGYEIEIQSDMSKLSKSNQSVLCKNGIPAIDMDNFAKKGYRKIILPRSITEDDSINTADAFLINKENKWYFIEFKDAIIGSNKSSILKKAYSNVYAILDVLYERQQKEGGYTKFTYDNPVQFIRENVNYILVFSAEKNPNETTQMKNHRLSGEKYLPKFMERLQGYIYKEAYAMTDVIFDGEFAKQFCYE